MSVMNLVPYKKEHALQLAAQPMNAEARASYEGGLAELLEKHSSMTVMVNDMPMVCGGVIEMWKGRGYLWTMFNEQSKRCFVPTFRGIQKFLDIQLEKYPRLEVAIPVSFKLGQRRAELLGFKMECPLAKKFLPNGEDCVLYSMVRGV